MRKILLPLTLAMLATLGPATTTDAATFGLQSDGELINSSVSRDQQAATLDAMRAQGARLARVNAAWNEIATPACEGQSVNNLRNPDNSCYAWGSLDGFVQEATQRGIQPLVSISRAPFWLHHNANPAFVGATSAQFTRTVEQYSAFMYAAAARYKARSPHGTVKLWTVWNEPNAALFFAPLVTRAQIASGPARYAQMLGRTAVAIRTANPAAAVAAGPTGPQSTIKPQTFVRLVQAKLPIFLPGRSIALKRRWVSAWAHNPYPGLRAPALGITRAPSIGLNNVGVLFKQLDAAPITRGMKVWATEFAYQTNPPDRVLGIPLRLQGQYIAEGFDLLDSTNRVPIVVYYGFTDPVESADFQSGTFTTAGIKKPSYAWWQRPISIPTGVVARGTSVRIWARSMVRPRATRVMTSTNGRNWKLLPLKGRRADGTTIMSVPVTATVTYFATWDGVRGPSRTIVAR